MQRKTSEIRIPAIPVIWIVFGLFLPLEGVLLWAYHTAPNNWKETIIFGATIVGGAFALYSHMKHIDETRSRAAQKLIERWNNPSAEFELMKDTLRNVRAGTLNVTTVMLTRAANGAIVLPQDMAARNRVVGLLGFCEEVALLVRTDHADSELIRRILYAVLKTSYELYLPWIEGERKAAGDEELYIELQELIKHWK
jgi:hypothetical protein